MVEVELRGLPCAWCGHPAIAFVPAVGTRHPGSVCRPGDRPERVSADRDDDRLTSNAPMINLFKRPDAGVRRLPDRDRLVRGKGGR